MDVVMMGAELLAGTDFKGTIPQYNPLAASENDDTADFD